MVLQWDPDHEPFTNEKYPRRAIQLGIRSVLLGRFAHEDITDFVKATKGKAMRQADPLADLWTPVETIYPMPGHLV